MAHFRSEPFAVEQWMDKYEDQAKHNIAEVCAASISLDDLRSLSEDASEATGPLFSSSTKLTYGSIHGSPRLRSNLADLYSAKTSKTFHADNIIITPGAITANLLVFYAFIRKGDHVIVHYPTYQQLYEIPASLAAEVSLWRSKEDEGWSLDIEELKGLIRPNTRMIVINNPQNPTGAVIPPKTLSALLSIMTDHPGKPILFADEVYRPLFHSISPLSPDFPPSLITLNSPSAILNSASAPASTAPTPTTPPNIIVSGSLSKSYSLAGIRVGWLASPSHDLLTGISQARDYTTISVSQIDDSIAAFALGASTVHRLLARNIKLARTNLEILETFVEKFAGGKDGGARALIRWTKPKAGTAAFVEFLHPDPPDSHKNRATNGDEAKVKSLQKRRPVDDQAFCETLIRQTGVMFVPGRTCFGRGVDFAGYVRIGFVCETDVLRVGLQKVEEFMKGEEYAKLPIWES